MGEHEQHDEIEYINVDYISNLHDYILQHILSFMPTKEVVKTSILSTRWNNLWATAPNIDFDNLLLCDRKVDAVVASFMKFLERVLQSRGASDIKKFRLLSYIGYENSQIQKSQTHSWISDAIAHNAQELDLTLCRQDPSMFPCSMFAQTSLVSLKIRTNFYEIKLPSCISFPCLKTLHIYSVVFPNDDHVEKLLLGCPVLKELALLDIWTNLKNIVISNSTLTTLSIVDKVRFQPLYDPTCVIKIKIDAPNLTHFTYMGDLSSELLLNNVSSIFKAMIFIPHDSQKEVICRVIGLLKRLQYVVSLTLSWCTMKYFPIFTDNNLDGCPVFPNLSHLMVTMQVTNNRFRILMNFLSFCPALQSICFPQGFTSDMHLGEKDSIWSSIPICMKNCVKRVTFENFYPYDSEICFLKCVLKYANVLERMDIWWHNTPNLNKKIEARLELESLKRSSPACVIKFS